MSDTISRLAAQVGRGMVDMILPLANDQAAQLLFLRQLGYDVQTPPPGLSLLAQGATPLVDALVELDAALDDLDAGVGDSDAVDSAFVAVVGGLALVVAAIEAFAAAASQTLPGFDGRFFGQALATILEAERPVLTAFLVVAGIVTRDLVTVEEPFGAPSEIVRRQFVLSRITDWFTDPSTVLSELYGWGTPSIDANRLFTNLEFLLRLRRRWPTRLNPTSEELAAYGVALQPDRSNMPPMLAIPLLSEGPLSLFLNALPVEGQPGLPANLALTLEVTGAGEVQTPIGDGWTLGANVVGNVSTGIGVVLRPGLSPLIRSGVLGGGGGTDASATAEVTIRRVIADAAAGNESDGHPIVSLANGAEVTAKVVSLGVRATTGPDAPEVMFFASLEGARASISSAGGDSFLSSLLPADGLDVDFDAGLRWSNTRGVSFETSAALALTIPVHQTIGPVSIDTVRLALGFAGGANFVFSADVGLRLGPVAATIQGIGGELDIAFHAGNLGFLDASGDFRFPTGIGVFIESSSVSGGGFLFFDEPNGRYGGALELRAYSIDIKAFGLIETKVPGVDFSFVIVISAEFNPIQLGFGFTLNGVGGLIGINRTVNSDEVSKRLRDGTVDNILFPTNLIQNAPQIISDLAALFPAADSRYVFGPLAKLGWAGIVNGTIGVILELPSKAVTLIGNINAILPKPDNAIVVIDMDIAGKLDFPKKHFELDATLSPNSKLGAYTITGDMATRIDWGDRPNFAISMGGFHSQFKPPPGFPRLRPLAIDLGLNGNPSVTLQGFMALTSNTAQIGAQLDIYASFGATLTGNVGFEAMFVFSPFSFDARLWGSVHVEFLGVGFGMTLNGRITGPSPWTIDGEVCVSLWFDSACVGIHEKLDGAPTPETLPLLDPWEGFPVNAPLSAQEVPGLRPAIGDPRNWAGRLPAGALIGVSYVERKGREELVDPVGIATLRQKSVPLAYDITQYAGRAPSRRGKLNITGTTVGGIGASTDYVTDWFAPGQYRKMSNDEALAAQPFEQLKAGVELQGKVARVGSVRARSIEYRTHVLDAQGNEVEQFDHQLPPRHLDGTQRSSSVARLSARLSGRTRFVDITQARKMTDEIESFSLTSKLDLTLVAGAAKVTRSEAAAALDALAGPSAFKRQQYQIVGFHLAV